MQNIHSYFFWTMLNVHWGEGEGVCQQFSSTVVKDTLNQLQMMMSNCGWFHVKQANLQRTAKAQENVSVLTFLSLE